VRYIGNQAALRRLSRTAPIQCKLEIGAIDDPLEAEADRVADQVMRTPDAAASLSASPRISRKCQECEEEEKQRHTVFAKRDGAQAGEPDEVPASVYGVLDSPGEPLAADAREFFEPRLGRSLENIRIHSGSQAHESARAVNALAYTAGSHIVFARGRFDPGSHSGRHLLAHELTHAVQQGAPRAAAVAPPSLSRKCGECEEEDKNKLQRQEAGSEPAVASGSPLGGCTTFGVATCAPDSHPVIRRAGDFDIRGVNPDAASRPGTIFFDIGSSTIPPSEMPKIAPLAAPAGSSLSLIGRSSEEGAGASNLAIINARIDAVKTALQSAGHTGPITPSPDPGGGQGNIDYRGVRTVDIVPAGGASPTPPCQVTAANPHPEVTACGTSFATAQPVALTKATNALVAVSAPTPATTATANTFFPGVAIGTIAGRLASLPIQLGIMSAPTRLLCHNQCDGDCSRPGYNSGQGAAAVMTVCPYFINTASLDERVELLLHEGMHATPGAPVVDTAYGTQRLITGLSGAQAETNTDSFVSLILALQAGAGPAAGPPTDPTPGMAGPDADAAKKALAFLEKWVEISEWDTSQLYDAIKRNIGRAGGWDPADVYHAETQHRIGWLLTLTDPGAGPTFATPPTKDDQVKVAGIHDRYQRLNGVVDRQAVTITRGAPEGWAPGPGNSVKLDSPFFALAIGDQVVYLLKLMTAAAPDIPAALRTGYAEAANQIRWHKGIGP
jgi:hypothetical protein